MSLGTMGQTTTWGKGQQRRGEMTAPWRKGKTLLELEETHSGNGKGLRHSQVVLEARDFL
jgi:hypothetical protein